MTINRHEWSCTLFHGINISNNIGLAILFYSKRYENYTFYVLRDERWMTLCKQEITIKSIFGKTLSSNSNGKSNSREEKRRAFVDVPEEEEILDKDLLKDYNWDVGCWRKLPGYLRANEYDISCVRQKGES